MSKKTTQPSNYRPDIDGLRAIAVLSVIFYHAGFPLFSGGFLGVDIFFVLSGYLITKIIYNENINGDFSYLRFYERRIKRLLPALVFVTLTTSCFGWFILLPNELQEYSKSLITTSLMSSNIFFWKTIDYFNSSSELKPLLHMWSLAVEEQFYLIFPLILTIFVRKAPRFLNTALIVITFASLLTAIIFPSNETSASFYLLHTRFWEMSVGSILSLNTKILKKFTPHKVYLNDSICVSALIVIFACFINTSEDSSFIAYSTLLSVLATAVLINSSERSSIIKKFLTLRPIVQVGLISYSAYLIHQPAFALYRELKPNELSLSETLILIALILITAHLSWKFIETPFRNLKNRRTIFSIGIVGTTLMLVSGWIMLLQSHNLYRFPIDERPLITESMRDVRASMKDFDRGGCFIDFNQTVKQLIEKNCIDQFDNAIILFGDSYAAHLFPGIKKAASHGYKVQQWTAASCRALPHQHSTKRCDGFYKGFFKNIAKRLTSRSTLIISSQWYNSAKKMGVTDFQISFKNLLDDLRGVNSKIIVIGQSPVLSTNPFTYLLRSKKLKKDYQYAPARNNNDLNAFLATMVSEYGHTFVNPEKELCQPNACLVRTPTGFMFFDRGHFSTHGSIETVKRMDLKSHLKSTN